MLNRITQTSSILASLGGQLWSSGHWVCPTPPFGAKSDRPRMSEPARTSEPPPRRNLNHVGTSTQVAGGRRLAGRPPTSRAATKVATRVAAPQPRLILRKVGSYPQVTTISTRSKIAVLLPAPIGTAGGRLGRLLKALSPSSPILPVSLLQTALDHGELRSMPQKAPSR